MRDEFPSGAPDHTAQRDADSANQRMYENRITERVREIFQARGVIEQAKGMLSVVYGLDTEEAFDCLVRLSQGSNQKVRSVAAQVVSQFPTLSKQQLPSRTMYDALLTSIAAHDNLG